MGKNRFYIKDRENLGMMTAAHVIVDKSAAA
jgi:hypothetical protein